MATKNSQETTVRKRRPPATTPEARENQLISLAVDLAEKQLREGTASAQTINHYLRLAGQRERAELRKLESEIKLREAQIESMESGKRIEELYDKAISAMRSYTGHDDEEEDAY